MKRAVLAVVAACLAGCGRGGDLGFGTVNDGIESDAVPPNGCVAPTSAGWTDQHAAFPNGETGDFCSYTGAGFQNGLGAWCLNNHLLLQTESAGASDFCFPDGGTERSPPTQVGACVESCGTSGGAVIDCPTTPARAPSRQIPSAWSLAPGDCSRLWSACPEVGDPCTGGAVCGGFWHPDQPDTLDSFAGENALMWCDGGSLQMVVSP